MSVGVPSKIVQVRKRQAGNLIGDLNPVLERLAVPCHMKVEGALLEFHVFSEEMNTLRVGLQEPYVAVTAHDEFDLRPLANDTIPVLRWNPRRRNHNVSRLLSCFRDCVFQILRGCDRDRECVHSLGLQDLCSVKGGDTKSNVTDTLSDCEILIAEEKTHGAPLQRIFVELLSTA